MNRNPIFGQQQMFAAFGRSMMIAMCPALRSVNGGGVTSSDRLQSERYLISITCKSDANIAARIAAMDPNKEVFERLKAIHGEVISAGTSGDDANNIASNLVAVKFQPAATSIMNMESQVKKLPSSMEIRDIKSLCARLYKFPVRYPILCSILLYKFCYVWRLSTFG